ncbi:MAG: imidazole glycerol phosphate synthase subunit HisH [Bacteroidetes bacterium]|nr:imidazole glycerol phosphate synthase subunit HisH [Bacteroidota bacterium]
MITVVDYGMGNLRSVRRALQNLGRDVLITPDPAKVRDASVLILPGVGAFGEAIRRIDGLGLRAPILDHVEHGRPLLGICLGMQLLFPVSEESPGVEGLSLFPGRVMRFRGSLPVPHVGWNDATPVRSSPLFDKQGGCFYFVHSYYVETSTTTVATTTYGETFACAVQSENVFGVQFHPEKSQNDGLALLRRFCEETGA